MSEIRVLMKTSLVMRPIYLPILLLFISTTGCGDGSDHGHDHYDTSETEDVYRIPDLETDNGAPWTANPETTDGIFAMIKLMDAHTDKENATSYNELAEALNAEFNSIFRNCTMTGEAHDQLHNYLYPLKEIFEGLRSSELNICKASFADLEQHLGQYFEFFE